MDIIIKLADYFNVTSDYLVRGVLNDIKEQSIREWSELIKGRSEEEIIYVMKFVKSLFDFMDNK